MIQLAERLGISRRRLYVYFKIMKDLGAPVNINFEKNILEYKTKFRIRAAINTRPAITPPTTLYKKIKDPSLERIVIYNRIDEMIFNENTGRVPAFAKKLKLRDERVLGNLLYEYRKNMGVSFYFDWEADTYKYRGRKRFNIILEVVPFEMPE